MRICRGHKKRKRGAAHVSGSLSLYQLQRLSNAKKCYGRTVCRGHKKQAVDLMADLPRSLCSFVFYASTHTDPASLLKILIAYS
jgi:hypothetical protein